MLQQAWAAAPPHAASRRAFAGSALSALRPVVPTAVLSALRAKTPTPPLYWGCSSSSSGASSGGFSFGAGCVRHRGLTGFAWHFRLPSDAVLASRPLAAKVTHFRAFASRPPSYYEVLGVPKTATQADIKRAYVQEAKKCHPDVSSAPDATRRFQELATAYSVLSDPSRRAEYDAGYGQAGAGYGQASQGSGARRSSPQWDQPPPPPSGDVDPGRLFRAVLEELGAEQAAEYLGKVRTEAAAAAEKAQAGDLGPAKEFAWRHKGLAAAVVLPAVVLLRFPGMVQVALRGLGVAVLGLLNSPVARETLGRWAWYQWRMLIHRAHARERSRRK